LNKNNPLTGIFIMWSTREIIIFCAGAQTFHTLSHLLMTRFCNLPIQLGPFVFTAQFNTYALLVNALITALLLWVTNRLK